MCGLFTPFMRTFVAYEFVPSNHLLNHIVCLVESLATRSRDECRVINKKTLGELGKESQ